MQTDTYIILAIILIGFLIIYRLLSKKLDKNSTDTTLIKWLDSMQHSISSNNQTLNQTLHNNYRDLHTRLDQATRIIGDLKREAGVFSEIGRGVRELQDFLKSPKLRGNIGEQVLKDLITQMFPKNSFHLQYSFKTGSIVDAAIKTSSGILPIDSKFPMENFNKMAKAKTPAEKKLYKSAFTRDIKKHTKSISQKYILTDEGTLDFALMYLPSESVYYELVNIPEILDYARKLRVYPVSPTTLYANLQTILLSFEGNKIEQKTKQVLQMLRAIQSDYTKLEDNFSILNKHLTNAYNQMNNATQTLTRLGQKLSSTTSLSSSTKN